MIFTQSKPVWIKNKALEMNCHVALFADIDVSSTENIELLITGQTIFKVYINENFLYFGPDRTAHNFARVRKLNLSPYLIKGNNKLKIFACGYNINGYGQINQPSYIQAEVLQNNIVIKKTSEQSNDFKIYHLTHKHQKIQKYSFQRGFMEAYSLTQEKYTNPEAAYKAETLENQPELKYIACTAPNADYTEENFQEISVKGNIETFENPKPLFRDRAIKNISKELLGFPMETLDVIYTDVIHHFRYLPAETKNLSTPLTIGSKQYAIWKMKKNYSGFIQVNIKVTKKAVLVVSFDEILSDQQVNHLRLSASNLVHYTLEPGNYSLETLEPYTFQFIQTSLLEGEAIIQKVGIRHVRCADTHRIKFKSTDNELNDIFETAIETFRQNAVDIYMDCPSRERAGWLCDSYFTGYSEKVITGQSRIEKAFIENYAIAEQFKFLPKGMVAMCFPADNYNGNFIPNWALWLILELEDYLKRTNDRELIDSLQKRVEGLFEYFETLINSDGLLENLQGWIFVEWSMANKFVNGINYPSNMLYAAALESASRLYQNKTYQAKAEKVKNIILRESFDGEFFRDNSIRENGVIVHTNNYSETCQYQAFFFNLVTPKSHPKLWETLVTKFGPYRDKSKDYPNVHPSNAFIGNLIRMDLLGKYGDKDKQIDEMKKYYLMMTKETGTFWENDNRSASLNHGFASHLCYFIIRDTLGVTIDDTNKKIYWKQNKNIKQSFDVTLPLAQGYATFKVQFNQNTPTFTSTAPSNYEIKLI